MIDLEEEKDLFKKVYIDILAQQLGDKVDLNPICAKMGIVEKDKEDESICD